MSSKEGLLPSLSGGRTGSKMAAPEERLLSEGEGGALGSARLSPPPVSESPEALAPLEPPPQSNTLMGLPIVAIESILSFLSYDETSQLRLVGAGKGRGGGGGGGAGERASERGALLRLGPGPAGGSPPRRGGFLPSRQPPPSLGYGHVGVCLRARVSKGLLPSLTSFIPFALGEKLLGCRRLFSLLVTAFLGAIVYCVSCVRLFLPIELEATSVEDGEPAAPRTLAYLEISAGQKKKA